MTFRNRIIQGNCATVMESIPDACIDLAVTDPPYLVNYRDRTGRTLAGDNAPHMVLPCFPELYRVMRNNSLCVCFYGWNRIELFMTAWKEAGFTPVGHIVWRKTYASRVGFLKSCHEQAYLLAKGHPRRPARPLPDVLPWEYSGNKFHPTEKAVSVLTPLIESFSRPGDTLVIWKMDRAFRSLIHALNVLEELEHHGVEFQSLTDDINTATAMGRFVYQIRNAFSELERALISERTRAGMAAARERGVTLGRPPKLTDEQIARARRELDHGRKTITRLAKELGIAPITLSRALNRDESSNSEL